VSGHLDSNQGWNAYKSIFKSSMDAVFLTTLDGEILAPNPAAEVIYGYTEEELCKIGIAGIVDGDDPQLPVLLEIMARTGGSKGELICVRKDGSKFPVEVSSSVFRDENSNKMANIVVRDITSHKKAEEESKENEELFRTVADFTYDWEYLMDPAGNFVYMSPSCERITGYRPEEFKKDPGLIFEITHPNDREMFERHVRSELTAKDHISLKFRIINRNGEERWISHICQRVYNNEGLFVGRRASNRDDTERELVEEALRVSYGRLELAERASRTGFWDWDMLNGKLSWSDELFGLFGLPNTTEPSFDIWLAIMSPDDREPSMGRINRSIRERTPLENEYRIIRSDGQERWIKALGDTFYDENGHPQRMTGICLDITRNKQIEQELLNSEERYRNLVVSSPDAIIVHSEGEIKFSNPAAVKLFGANDENELIGKPILNIVADDTRQLVKERIKLAETQQTPPKEMKYIGIDGSSFYGEATGKKIIYNKKPAIQVVIRDITERKEAEKSIKENEEKLRSLFDTLPVGISILDEERNVIVANPALEKILELPQEDLLKGKYVKRKYIRSDLTEMSFDDLPSAKVYDEGKPVEDVEVGVIKEDNSIIWTNVTAIPLSFSDWRVLVTTSDITKRKVAENLLKQSEKRAMERRAEIEAIYNSAPIGLCIFDRQLRYLRINERLAELNGFPAEDHIGKTVREVLPFLADFIEEIGQKVIETGEPALDIEFTGETPREPGVKRTFLEEWTPITDNGKVIAINVAILEITEIKKAEEELKETLKRLERSNADLQQFAYVASHDLREPLRMITSFLQLLERRYTDQLDEDAHEFIGFAVEGAKRLDGMINDLLTYSRVTTEKRAFARVNLEIVLKQVLANLKALLDENDAVVTHEPLPVIYADHGQMVQLLQNLVSNAIKYRSEENPRIHVSAAKNGGEYVFTVDDNGIGIDPEHLKRIFTIFQRLHTRDKYEGSGIGLAIAQKIVHQHGGQIWAESEPGKGSKFYFTIPLLRTYP
jgi:PAS domain S-box-containing protein